MPDPVLQRWADVALDVGFIGAARAEVVALLRNVYDQLEKVCVAEPFLSYNARAIGALLAGEPLTRTRMIAETLEILLTVRPQEPARWQSVVCHAMEGYADALVERSLAQQEQILAATATAHYLEVTSLQRQLHFQATHDSLTGLVNRARFREVVAGSVADRPGEMSILFIDLDGFKSINDSHGHHYGDQLLLATAHRLRATVRPGDTVARYGGDEFVIASPCSTENAAALAKQIQLELAEPFEAFDETADLNASIGIANHPALTPGEIDALVDDADLAMYLAKTAGGDHIAISPRLD